MERRALLCAVGTVGMGTVSGCIGSRGSRPRGSPSDGDTGETDHTPSATPTDRPDTLTALPDSIRFGFPIPVVSVLNSPVYPGLDQVLMETDTTIGHELYRSSNNVVSGLLGGEIDMGYVSLLSLVNARNEGFPLVSILGNFMQLPFPILADPAITDWEDLRGKRVAVNATVSITAAAVRLMVKRKLGDADAIELVQIPANPDRIAALDAGHVDAIAVALNGAIAAENQGVGQIFAYPWDLDDLRDVSNTVWIVDEETLQENEAAFGAIVNAFRDAYRWCYETPAGEIVTLARESGQLSTPYDRHLQVDTVETLQEIDFWPRGDGVSKRKTEKFLDVLVETGMLREDDRPAYEQLVDDRFTR